MRDDKLALLHKSCEQNLVAINTPHGLTDRKNIASVVQQGGTWGPILCSNSIDTMAKEMQKTNRKCFKYKNTTTIYPLTMIDDINAISTCGLESLSLNTYLNSKIENKKLRFHTPDESGRTKCFKMHIGRKSSTCPVLKVHGTVMQEVSEVEYLGDMITSDGKNRKNLKKRISRGMGAVTNISCILREVSFGKHYVQIALLLRETLFLSTLLFNVEVWYNITKSEIKELENLDVLLLRKILTRL